MYYDGGAPYDGTSPLYGIAEYGGQNAMGTVFRLKPTSKGQWSARTLYSFCAQAGCADGSDPAHDLLLDASGNLYGVTGAGGGAGNPGVVFKLSASPNASWHQTVLHAFCAAPDCADGQSPSGGLVMDSAGNLYGTTYGGGGNGYGVVFELSPGSAGWTYQVLNDFCWQDSCGDGRNPQAGLIIDSAGNLYGTTTAGGSYGYGVVFELRPTSTGWSPTVLYSF